jgi:hypothetical protein
MPACQSCTNAECKLVGSKALTLEEELAECPMSAKPMGVYISITLKSDRITTLLKTVLAIQRLVNTWKLLMPAINTIYINHTDLKNLLPTADPALLSRLRRIEAEKEEANHLRADAKRLTFIAKAGA